MKSVFYNVPFITKRQCFAIALAITSSFHVMKASAQCTTGSCTPANTISTANSSNLTISSGQVYCVVSGGSLTGSLTINSGGQLNVSGGSVATNNTTINGAVVISSGTFAPSNFVLNSGGTVCNGTNGVLKPSSSINTYQGTITNYGSADFSQGISAGSGGVYDNYGTTRFRSGFNWNGAFTLTNEVGGIMTLDQNLNINGNSTYNNRGKTYVNANFEISGGSTFNNTGRVEITGATSYEGIVNNSGFVYNNGPSNSSNININTGSTVTNNCRFVTTAGFNNNSPNTKNYGLIWVLNSPGNNPDVQINATFAQSNAGLLRGTNFVNNSTITGISGETASGGNFYFTGSTTNQGSAIFGTGTTAPNFYDVSNTPTSANRGFDVQNATVGTNETHNAFMPADTTNYTSGCNSDFAGIATAKDSSLNAVTFPTNNTTTIMLSDFTGTSLSSGIPNGTITRIIFTALPANCSYIIINGIKYGTGGIPFPAAGDTVNVSGASNTITLGLLSTAATAAKVLVPFKIVNSQGFTSSNTANVTQPFSGVLPVTFGNISATSSNCNIAINFETLTEQNNKSFVIQYSNDGNAWVDIATLLSKGDANFKQTYSFVHTSAATGSNYYRIQQIDKDGASTYSNTLFVNLNCGGTSNTITSYPNSITDNVTIGFPNTTGQKTVKIVDILGRVLLSTTTTGNMVNLSTSNLLLGIYGLEVIADGQRVYSQKLLKK